jgi:hypothetical protein
MFRITAEPLITKMIYLLATWDIPKIMSIYDQMDGHSAAVQTGASVSSATTITGCRSLPNVARCFISSIPDLCAA